MSKSSDDLNKLISSDMVEYNKSFSGVDMVAMAHITLSDGKESILTLGSIQTLTYSIHMDRKPIRSLGNVNIKDYVCGPRTIAGSLIFAVFNKHFMYEAIAKSRDKVTVASISDQVTSRLGKSSQAFLADELPPFNITVSFANEYGAQAKLVIYGVRLVNEGQVMSVNDIYTENTYQFFASDIEYLNDDVGHSSGGSSSGNSVIGSTKTSNSSGTSGKDIANHVKNSYSTGYDQVSLIANQHAAANDKKKGTAYFVVSPAQPSGKIHITGGHLTTELTVDVNQSGLKIPIPIYVNLDAGSYVAQYIDAVNYKRSNKCAFTIDQLHKSQYEQYSAPPVIESVTDTQISVYSNNPAHTLVMYGEVVDGDPTYKSAELKGRRAVIGSLKPGSGYLIYTRSNTSRSFDTVVKTLTFNNKPFEDVKEMTYNNENRLTYGGILDEYYGIIDQASIYAQGKPIGFTVLDALIYIRDDTQKKLVSAKVSDYKTYDEYSSAISGFNKKLVMLSDLIRISMKITNDVNYAYNQKAVVKPPAPEIYDYINNVFLMTEDVERLDFYRQYQNVSQFVYSVDKINFKDHVSGKKAYTFYGKPGLKHYVYAYDLGGNKSSRVDFYILTDEERQKVLAGLLDVQDFYDKQIANAESDIGTELSALKLLPIDYKRALIQYSKRVVQNLFPAPVVVESSTTAINVDVDYKDNIGQFNNDYYVVIAAVDDALSQQAFYKIKINKDVTSVTFTAEAHGIKPDTAYAIWIEDSSFVQVSPCTTVAIYNNPTEDIIEKTSEVELYFNGKTIDQIEKVVANKVLIDDTVKTIMDNLRDDITVNQKNVYDRIIQNILSFRPKIANANTLVESVLEAKLDIVYHIDTAFMPNATLSKADHKITFPAKPEDYMVTVMYIDSNGIAQYDTFRSVAGSDYSVILDTSKGNYAAVFAVRPDVFDKSGLIFANLLTNEYRSYMLQLGGI